MRFPRFGPQTKGSLNRAIDQVASRRVVIENVVKAAVRFGAQEWNGILRDVRERSRLFERPWPPVVLYEAPKPFAEVLGRLVLRKPALAPCPTG